MAEHRAAGAPVPIVGTDEHGETDIADLDLTGPVLLLIGNKTAGIMVNRLCSAKRREYAGVLAQHGADRLSGHGARGSGSRAWSVQDPIAQSETQLV